MVGYFETRTFGPWPRDEPIGTYVYIDGFNLYYGAVKGTGYKWLDLVAMARRLVPDDDVVRVRYFTANVTPRPSDPTQAIRQQVYLRALATSSLVSIHLGQFRERPKWMPKHPIPKRSSDGNVAKPTMVQVVATEEKGSDVNLASYLLRDTFRKLSRKALVISNDSDLATPITMVQEELGVPVGVANPHPAKERSFELKGTFFRQIRPKLLADCQLPTELRDAEGLICRPPTW